MPVLTRCACPHSDAQGCADARYPRPGRGGEHTDDPEADRGEPCTCSCHDGDCDEESGW